MGVPELWYRILEKVRKITEPFALSEINDVRIAQEPADCPTLPSRDAAPVLLKLTLASDAAKLLDGKWSLFGWKEVQVTSPPEWQRDYMRGVSVPVSGKLNHRALPGGADARAIWEINRWAEMVRLAMHGWLNDDLAAIQHAQVWLAEWVEKNRVGQGINWTSALEGGLRLINFCWFDALVSNSENGKSELGRVQSKLRDAIVPAHVWWVKRHLSFGSSANNHRLGELTGLLLAVKRWPEMECIAGNAEELWNQIADCVLSQFAEDGGNREQALHYHLFAFEMAIHACRAMNVHEGQVTERLQRAAEFFVRMSHQQEPWDYGDRDDAQIVPLTMQRGKATAEWSAWMRQCSSGMLPETSESGILPDEPHADSAMSLNYWLGEALRCGQNARATHRSQTCATDWWIAQPSGMAVIERNGWKVRVDASPLGFGKMAAHGHCDALHVSIWDGDHALVIDPGTGGYFGAEKHRAELASWNAHNGPQPVEGFKTPRRVGTFLWVEHHSKPELEIISKNSIETRIRHERFFLSRKVTLNETDVVIEDREHTGIGISVRWHLAPNAQVIVESPDSFLVNMFKLTWRVRFKTDRLECVVLSTKASGRFDYIESAIILMASGIGRMVSTFERL